MNKRKKISPLVGLLIYYSISVFTFFIGKSFLIYHYHLNTLYAEVQGTKVLANWVSAYAIVFLLPIAAFIIMKGDQLLRKKLNAPKKIAHLLVSIGVVPVVLAFSLFFFWEFLLSFYMLNTNP
ncbi:hypothetical protein [Marininema halotolerans]|uniref:Uncharacterized protein n=1 Tax=Marininema halotolerans TaxID=1155944 RepID=A0A1I6NRV2_9BACL|nr:hypothetical protein [Marininema halotolerans]SFS30736.1 hypothetical protein SAMN05444972_10174 [Marininema halotolerans]